MTLCIMIRPDWRWGVQREDRIIGVSLGWLAIIWSPVCEGRAMWDALLYLDGEGYEPVTYPDDDDPFEDWTDEDDTCLTCGGEGEVCVCPDDLCQGAGECIHGDGMALCPDCHGRGYVSDPDPAGVAEEVTR